MSQVKISQLESATNLNNTDFIPIVNDGVTRKTTLSNLAESLSSYNIIDVNSNTAALRITQRGTGDALVIEDTTNPDSTPFVITQSGLVGIGTSTPYHKLTVSGSISAFDGSIYSATNFVTDSTYPQYLLRSDISNNNRWSIWIDERTPTTGKPLVIGPQDTFGSGAHLMTFTRTSSSGNGIGKVGIGTTAPNELLTVVGNISATDAIRCSSLYVYDSIYSDDSGYGKIEVGGVSGAYIDLKSPRDEDLDIRLGTGGTGGYISTSTGNILLQPGGLGNVILKPGGSGKIGIGTNSPTEDITMVGSISAVSTRIVFTNLPTSAVGLPAGALYNDSGFLKIV